MERFSDTNFCNIQKLVFSSANGLLPVSFLLGMDWKTRLRYFCFTDFYLNSILSCACVRKAFLLFPFDTEDQQKDKETFCNNAEQCKVHLVLLHSMVVLGIICSEDLYSTRMCFRYQSIAKSVKDHRSFRLHSIYWYSFERVERTRREREGEERKKDKSRLLLLSSPDNARRRRQQSTRPLLPTNRLLTREIFLTPQEAINTESIIVSRTHRWMMSTWIRGFIERMTYFN